MRTSTALNPTGLQSPIEPGTEGNGNPYCTAIRPSKEGEPPVASLLPTAAARSDAHTSLRLVAIAVRHVRPRYYDPHSFGWLVSVGPCKA